MPFVKERERLLWKEWTVTESAMSPAMNIGTGKRQIYYLPGWIKRKNKTITFLVIIAESVHLLTMFYVIML